MKKVVVIGLLVIGFVVTALLISKAGRRDSLHEQTRFLMGTYCTIQAVGPEEDVKIAVRKAFGRMQEIDDRFNPLNPGSPIYAFNEKNAPIRDRDILEVVELARQVSEECAGAFDITVYPLGELWGFYPGDSSGLPAGESGVDPWGEAHLPEKKEIDDCLARVGYKNLVFEDGEIRKLNPDVHIDFGAIAKGYAIDEASKILRSEGITSALIDAGGDIYAIGEIEGEGWGIGLRNPRGEGVIGVVQASDLAVVTSGDYEKFFEIDGIRYCHIIDPRTGYPSRSLISVSVIGPDAVLADAWATALFVMGPEEGMKRVEQMPDMETVMVTPDERILYSSGLKENLEVIGQ